MRIYLLNMCKNWRFLDFCFVEIKFEFISNEIDEQSLWKLTFFSISDKSISSLKLAIR